LRRSVDDAVAGRGQVVLLTGEAGIGKTTMLTEAAQYAESRGARTAWGWGWPDEGAPGYWLWTQVTRALGLGALPGDRVLPGVGAPAGSAATGALAAAAAPAVTGAPAAAATLAGSAETDAAPASARFQLFDEVASRLLAESRIQPLTILLDDLQWADVPSLLLLDFLARRLPAGSAAVIGSYRDVGPAPGEVLEGLSARSTVLPLAGLPAAAVTQLLARVAGDDQAASLGAEVHRRTGGNPFFVQQLSWLLQSGTGGLPPGIRQALDQRFAELTEQCAAILSAAAVAGQRFTASLVASVTGAAADQVAAALGEAVRARVLADDPPDGYRFAHDLFREFAAQRLAASARAAAPAHRQQPRGRAGPRRGRLAGRAGWAFRAGRSGIPAGAQLLGRGGQGGLPAGWPMRKLCGTGSERWPLPARPGTSGWTRCLSWRMPATGRARVRPRDGRSCARPGSLAAQGMRAGLPARRSGCTRSAAGPGGRPTSLSQCCRKRLPRWAARLARTRPPMRRCGRR